jgi:hypothetical protein
MPFGSKEWAEEHTRRYRQQRGPGAPVNPGGAIPRKAIEDFVRHWRNVSANPDVREVLVDLENLLIALEGRDTT